MVFLRDPKFPSQRQSWKANGVQYIIQLAQLNINETNVKVSVGDIGLVGPWVLNSSKPRCLHKRTSILV